MSETASEPNTVTYAIDGQDRLMEVDASWASFAEINQGGRTLRPESVVGRSLWDYIRDPQLQMCYKQLLEVVRYKDSPVEFQFRCDSPLLQRHMRMTMRREAEDCVTFVCTTERTVPQQKVLELAAASAVGERCRRCSLCNLFHLDGDEWGEVHELVSRCEVLNRSVPPTVIWTVCPSCNDRMSVLGQSVAGQDDAFPDE